jgi:hypothetical protein
MSVISRSETAKMLSTGKVSVLGGVQHERVMMGKVERDMRPSRMAWMIAVVPDCYTVQMRQYVGI